MFRNRWIILVGALVVIGLLAWGWRHRAVGQSAVDLVKQLPQAQKRSVPLPVDEAIQEVSVTINGETKSCILEQSESRILFHLTPPADAWFSASLAIDPAVWDKAGDGVLFRMGIGDGKGGYEELLNQYVNPAGNPADRRWIPVSLDLSAFAGQDVYLILNSTPSLPRQPRDLRNDRALWGAPMLVVGR
jgi:hypothetical protein